jgi:hypothetical protein
LYLAPNYKEDMTLQIKVSLVIRCQDPDRIRLYNTVQKTYETDLIPMVGMDLQDTAWHEPRPIGNVTIDPGKGCYYIELGQDSFRTAEECEQQVQMYRSHGWTPVNNRDR